VLGAGGLGAALAYEGEALAQLGGELVQTHALRLAIINLRVQRLTEPVASRRSRPAREVNRR